MSHLPLLIPLSLLLPALVIPLVGFWRSNLTPAVASLGAGLSFAFAVFGLLAVLSQGELRYQLGGWPPPIGIEYVLDALSAFMAALITGIGLVALIHARRSLLREVPDRIVPFYALALLLLAGLTGIVVTGDLFNLYVFLEIASLSAYALMAVGDERAPVSAFRYLILGSIGGSFYLLGVGFIYFTTGSLNMSDVAQRLPGLYESRSTIAAATFMVVGLSLKMALFPLHLWLPDAYTYAPSAASALIAPIMTKVAAYGLIRLFLTVFEPTYLRDMLPVASIIGWLAAAGVLFGSVMAIAQSDFRRMLAYSSVSQIAYVGVGIGLANPLGLIGALLHILNHAFMKGCLFLVAGSIRFRTGISDIPAFAGLGRTMPWTMAGFSLAALSMVGVPPTAGFFSKWYLVLAGIDASNWTAVAVILASTLLNAVYFFRILEKLYLVPPHGGAAQVKAREVPFEMLGPVLFLAAGLLFLGLANAVIVDEVLEPIVASLYNLESQGL